MLDITDELIDRYGDVPKSVYGLIRIALLRTKAEKAGIDEIVQSGDNLLLYTEKPDFEMVGVCGDVMKDRVALNMTGRVNVKVKIDGGDPLECLREFLGNYCRS